MYLVNEDTICAPATVVGTGAITVLRVSGPDTFDIVDRVVSFKRGTVAEAKGYTMKFGTVHAEGGEVLDEVIVSVFRAPHSYTGENSVEISCHASRYIVEHLMMLLVKEGCRTAEPGEFTQRAFLNGKMDLAQAEAVADVIASGSAAAHRVAFNQMKGGFSSELRGMRDELLNLVSLMELELDFSEEEVEFADRTRLNSLLTEVISHVCRLIDSFRLGNAIKNGVPVAIAGSTNAGKSTLLNALLGEERAIVSDVHGTTRDTIEEVLNIEGILFRFIDTAGIRETAEIVEKIGIERTFKKIKEAEIVLGMVDMSREGEAGIAEAEAQVRELVSKVDFDVQKLVILLNKADLMGENEVNKNVNLVNKFVLSADFKLDIIPISAKTGSGLSELKKYLFDYQNALVGESDHTLVTNLRHVEALSSARESLLRVQSGLASGIPTDLAAQDIRESLYYLGSIIGEISTDEVLGNIFRNFCIGK
jgi:tRNA modification GTPase